MIDVYYVEGTNHEVVSLCEQYLGILGRAERALRRLRRTLGWPAMLLAFALVLRVTDQLLVRISILEMLSHPQKMLSKSDDLILLIVPVDHRDFH